VAVTSANTGTSRSERVWVSPSSVRRVLAREGLRLRPLPRPGRSIHKPFPDWACYRPGSIWIYDTTHFTRAGVAATVIEDLVSRKWLAEIVSSEEPSTQLEVVFTQALEREGLLERVTARHEGLVDPTVDDPSRPILLILSDNGPQMTSGSTREFMALCAIHQHFGRPGTPTDQAWTWVAVRPRQGRAPHLLAIRDSATLRAELAVVREHYNGVRLHAGIGYVTPDDEHEGRGQAIRKARRAGLEQPACSGLHGTASTVSLNRPRSPAMLANRTKISIANSETHQPAASPLAAGQRTNPWVQAAVLAVVRMAEFARRHGVEVEVATFEAWQPAGRVFDTVIAEQAWHWVDAVAGAARAAQALRPGGRLAVLWHVFHLPPDVADALIAAHQRVASDSPFDLQAAKNPMDAYQVMCANAADGIRQAGQFSAPEQWRFGWQRNYSRDEWLDQIPTTGPFTQLEPDKLAQVLDAVGAAIDDLGGSFTMPCTTVTVTAARTNTT
jgi:transposase InsO family protein